MHASSARRCALLGFCLLLGMGGLGPAEAAATFIPQDDAQVLERLPRPPGGADRELRRLRARLAANPDDLAPALAFAERALAIGQTLQDPRYVGYAKAALAPWLARPDAPAEILALRGTIAQSRHAFEAALADFAAALARDPREPRAWLGRAVVLQVQGRPVEALASCRALGRTGAALLATLCQAGALERGGQAEVAMVLLKRALAAGLPAELELWARTLAAEAAQALGDAAEAQAQLARGLALGREDAYLVSLYADFLLDAGRCDEVLALVGDDIRNDGKLLRKALALKALHLPELAAHLDALEARFAQARIRGDRTRLREEARFALSLLEQPPEALALAQENWASQREPADARLLLEAALAAGRPEAAAPVLAWLEETRLQHPRISALAAAVQGRQG